MTATRSAKALPCWPPFPRQCQDGWPPAVPPRKSARTVNTAAPQWPTLPRVLHKTHSDIKHGFSANLTAADGSVVSPAYLGFLVIVSSPVFAFTDHAS